MRVNQLSVIGSILVLGIFLLPAVLATASYAAGPPVFSTPINLSNDSAKAIDPNVQNVGSKVFVTWTEGSGGIRFRNSSNGGVTWSPPITSPALKISGKGGVAQYPLMSVNGSNVYIVWSQSVNKFLQVFEATSTNGGLSFNTPVQLTNANTTGGYITPVIASWGINVYIAYVNSSNQESYVRCSASSGASGSWTNAYLFGTFHEPQLAAVSGKTVYAVSDRALQVSSNNCGIGAKTGDVNWTDNTPAVGVHAEPWLAVSGHNVYAVWETKHSTSQVQVMNSNTSGVTWKAPINLSLTLPDAWNPMVGAFGNKSWIALQQFPGVSNSQIYVYTTSTAGKNWSAPTTLSGKGAPGSSTSFPFNVASSDGLNVFVGWSQQVSSGYWVMRVGYSADGGTTWTAAPGINVSQNTVGQAGNNQDVATAEISANGTHCYAVWQYINGASNQIYFSSS